MRKGVKITLGILTILLVMGVIYLSPVFFWIYHLKSEIDKTEKLISQPETCRSAAIALARVCQSDPNFFTDDEWGCPAWMPRVILALDPSYMQITPTTARVEFGGGFHHFGYSLRLDESLLTISTNKWVLSLYREESPDITLCSVELPKSEHVESAAMIDNAVAEYKRRTMSKKVNREVISSRLLFLLKHHQDQKAIDSIYEFAGLSSANYVDQILAFILDYPLNPDAAGRLLAWADTRNDFTSWIYVAYAYAAVNDWDSAEKYVLRALQKPIDDPEWTVYNARAKCLPLCVKLCRAGQFSTCEKLCNGLLKYSGAGTAYEKQLKYLSDAAKKGIRPPDKPEDESLGLQQGCDPLEKIDMEKLKAIKSRFAGVKTLETKPSDK